MSLLRSSPLVRWGLPLVLFTVTGYVGLTAFVEGKVAATDGRVKKQSERAALLAFEHKAVTASLTDDYVMRPIPRPQEN
jgi:hypothetical protein